jgi:putative FmdB family regulatory protein
MPTYQYACTNAECGHRFEQVQSFTDAAITDCPQCSERVRKVYGSVGVVFKGSGFYRTDSRDAKAASAPAKSESGSGSESSSGSGSESGSGSKSGDSGPAKTESSSSKSSPTKSAAPAAAAS